MEGRSAAFHARARDRWMGGRGRKRSEGVSTWRCSRREPIMGQLRTLSHVPVRGRKLLPLSEGDSSSGVGYDGGHAPYVLVPEARFLVPIGDLDPVEAAPLTDAGLTTYTAIKSALPGIYPGSTAVVIGIGGLGFYAIQFLTAADWRTSRRGRLARIQSEAGPGVRRRRRRHEWS